MVLLFRTRSKKFRAGAWFGWFGACRGGTCRPHHTLMPVAQCCFFAMSNKQLEQRIVNALLEFMIRGTNTDAAYLAEYFKRNKARKVCTSFRNGIEITRPRRKRLRNNRQSITHWQVKTAVVGVPCGIEGSMINEFVEAQSSQETESRLHDTRSAIGDLERSLQSLKMLQITFRRFFYWTSCFCAHSEQWT